MNESPNDSRETATDKSPHRSPTRLMRITMCGCVVVVQSIVAAVNLIVPPLTADALRPSPAQVTLVVDAYILAFACLLIPSGAAAARFGHRRVLAAGLAGYTIGCLASALATNVVELIIARSVTGFGAAMVLPTSLAILTRSLPEAERAPAVAAWTASTFLGGAVGNVVAGVAVHYGSWRTLFVVQSLAAAVLLVAAVRVVPDIKPFPRKFDTPGAVVFGVSVVLALAATIYGPELGWTSAGVIGAYAVAALATVLFLRHERRRDHPMIDLRLFASPRLRAGVVGTTLLFCGMAALFLGNSQFLQYCKGFTPLQTGFASLPLAIGLFLASRLSVAALSRLGPRITLAIGLGGVAAALFTLSLVTPAVPYPVYALVLAAIATGTGLASPTLSAGIMARASDAQAGAIAGINSLSREVGSALGVALFSTVTITRFGTQLGGVPTDDKHHLLTILANSPPGGWISQAFDRAAGTAYAVLALIALTAAPVVLANWKEQQTQPKDERLGETGDKP